MIVFGGLKSIGVGSFDGIGKFVIGNLSVGMYLIDSIGAIGAIGTIGFG